jgi:hypothetical protein
MLLKKALRLMVAAMVVMVGLCPAQVLSEQGDDNDGTVSVPDQGQGTSTRSFTEEDGDLVLTHGLMDLKFNASNGGLVSLFDPSTMVEFRPDTDTTPTLFLLEVVNSTGVHVIPSHAPCTLSYQGSDDAGGSTLTLNFENLSGLDMDVTATIGIRDDDPRSYWDISVMNRNDTIAPVRVVYPVILGLPSDIGSNGKGDMLAVPKLDGIVYDDPYPKTQNGDLRFQYPGTLSMQFMALYDPLVAGLQLETLDTDGNMKEFMMVNEGPAGNVMAGIGHLGPETLGADMVLGYQCTVSIFHGDWYAAADLYKEWARFQPWTTRGWTSQRSDVPDWWLTPSPVVMIDRTDPDGEDEVLLEQWSEVVADLKALTGTNITLLVNGWERNGTRNGPFNMPPMDGATEVETEIKEVIVAGGRVQFATSERLWTLSRTGSSYDGTGSFQAYGEAYAVQDREGQPVLDPYAGQLGIQAAVMDTTTVFWQDMVKDQSSAIADLDVDVYRLDDVPRDAWVPCYNATHGHPQGNGSHITDGHLEVLTSVLAAGRAVNPDMVLATDQVNELFIDKVQTYLSHDNAPELGPFIVDLHDHGDDARPAPMFSYVYHPFITSYGMPVGLGGLDYLSHFNSSTRAIARAFVDGRLVPVSTHHDGSDHQAIEELFERTASAMATYAKDYIYLGEMLAPPVVHSPFIEVPYYDSVHGDTDWTSFSDHQVLSSAWRTEDKGRIGHVLVNWANTSVDISITIPSYHLSNDNFTLYITRNGVGRTLVNSTTLPKELSLTLNARDVVLIEVLSGPDAVVEQVRPDLYEVVVGEPLPIEVDVANRGSMDLSNMKVFMYEDGVFFANGTVPWLGPDTNTTLGFEWSTEYKEPGDHNITARIWPMMGEITKDNNEVTVTVRIVPPPVGTIRCTVIDNSTKAPLVGALVTLFDPSDRAPLDFAVTRSGTDVLFEDLPPGVYGVNASMSDYYEAEDLTVAVASDNVTIVTLSLDPVPVIPTTGDIIGYVLIENTTIYLLGTTVYLMDTNQSYHVSWDGMFQFQDVPAGNYTLDLNRHGYYEKFVNITVVAGETLYLNISMKSIPYVPQLGDIVGVVVDMVTEVPVEGALVLLWGHGIVVETNSSGGFLFTNRSFDNYTLNISANGYIPTNVTVEVKAVGANLVSVRLRPVGVPLAPFIHLKGYVMDEKGRPVEHATIKVEVGTNLSVVETDAQGLYHIFDLNTGSLTIEVGAKGYEDQLHLMIIPNGGTYWKNITLRKEDKDTGTTEDPVVTMALVGLNVVMLVGILVLLSTGRKGSAPKKVRKVVKARTKRRVVVDDDETVDGQKVDDDEDGEGTVLGEEE